MPFTPWIRHVMGVRGTDGQRVCQECGETFLMPNVVAEGPIVCFERDEKVFIGRPLGNVVNCVIDGGQS
jgi:hypothetical protein